VTVAGPTSRGPGPTAASSPTAVPSSARRVAELGVLLTVLIWSANFVIVKASIGVLGPLTFTGSRYVVASLTLLAILRWRQGTVRPPAGQALILVGLGVMGFGCYQVLWTTGLTQITAGDSALIVAASPVLTALLAGAVGMDRLAPPKLLGALIAFVGVAVVIGTGQQLSLSDSIVGDLLTLGAAGLFAIYTVAGTRVLRRVDPLQATTWSVVGGTLVLVPLALAEASTAPAVDVSPATLVAIIYSGALAAGISNVFVFNAIRYVGPTRASAMQLLVPAMAVALGAVFLAEPIGIGQVAGGVVIVLGVWLTRRPSLPRLRLRSRLSSAA
jgi:drug/metabolite transporter (DMT)-like permease